MKTILIILIGVFFLCGPFYMIIGWLLEKIEEKHSGCEVYIILGLGLVLGIGGIIGAVKSCSHSNHYPTYDYYEDRAR